MTTLACDGVSTIAHATIASVIPHTTPRPRLVVLSNRYRNATDPAIASLPAWYRRAMLARIDAVLSDTRGAA